MKEAKTLEALFPNPRRTIFAAIYAEPGRWWSLSELAGRAGMQGSTLRHHLTQLREAGMIREKAEGGRPWFQPDPACPIFDEMQAIVTKLAAQSNAAETILIVEDQAATAQITRILLESWGYKVIETHGAEEAIRIFDNDGDGVHLVLTDVLMPGMTGPQLANELTRRKPELRIVFMSGYPADQLSDSDATFLPKPFNPASLARIIRKELDRPAAPRRQMKSS
jgi:two-component system, cell cycle sensor histidine kinase and response regulator CckA